MNEAAIKMEDMGDAGKVEITWDDIAKWFNKSNKLSEILLLLCDPVVTDKFTTQNKVDAVCTFLRENGFGSFANLVKVLYRTFHEVFVPIAEDKVKRLITYCGQEHGVVINFNLIFEQVHDEIRDQMASKFDELYGDIFFEEWKKVKSMIAL